MKISKEDSLLLLNGIKVNKKKWRDEVEAGQQRHAKSAAHEDRGHRARRDEEGSVQDIEKAIWYLQRYLAVLKNSKSDTDSN
jgi:hypothetical protein